MKARRCRLAVFMIMVAGLALIKAEPAGASDARVRVTTGYYSVAGWEKNLVTGNRNLSHFTWLPVTGYIQGTALVRQPKGPDLALIKRKPKAVSRVILVEPPAVARRPIYIKPIHIATVLIRKPAAAPDTSARLRVPGNDQVSARLRLPGQDQVSARLRLPGERNVSARLARQKEEQGVNARLRLPADESVEGQLANRNTIAVYKDSYAVLSADDATVDSRLRHHDVYGHIRGCRSF